MRLTTTMLIVAACVLCLVGCETAKGFKRDVENTINYSQRKDSWLYKADQWVREHMW